MPGRRALVLGLPQGQEQDVLAQLPVQLLPDDWLEITQPEGVFRFLHHRVQHADDTATWTITGRPSSGTGGRWRVYVVQPESQRASVSKALRTRLLDWGSTRLDQLLGPFTPVKALELAPAKLQAALLWSWVLIWGGETRDGQLAQDDPDLDVED